MTQREHDEARAAYSWSSVEKDIAFATPLTLVEAGAFGAVYMESSGVHPYDLVTWITNCYHDGGDATALRRLILAALASKDANA